MEFKEFSRTGKKVSVLGMGTYYDPGWIASAKVLRMRTGKERHIRAIKSGLDAGINLIDTAEIYGTEPLVAEAINGFDRESIFIATKVWMTHLRHDSLISACDRSLKNLGTKYIDLYQIHFPNRLVKIEESMKAMEKLVSDGKIRHIGVSNFSLPQMIEAENALGNGSIASTQMPYNLYNRDLESAILPHCKEKGIAVLAYYPLAHGKLGSDRKSLQETVADISRSHGGKTPAQIVLNWFYSKQEGVFPIPRASSELHVKENVESTGWRLSNEELTSLENSVSK